VAKIRLPKLPTIEKLPVFGKKKAEPKAYPPPPETWAGSLPEWAIYHALITLGKREGIDFIYQSSQMGGRLEKGGAVIDFLFLDPPNLAINVQSTYYHYRTATQRTRGALQKAQIESYGIRLIYIQEENALREPRWFVMEALSGREH